MQILFAKVSVGDGGRRALEPTMMAVPLPNHRVTTPLIMNLREKAEHI
jgi:hypothetical protein